jgi:predicted kinase
MTNTTTTPTIKPVAYMLVGVPGSGKSTWAEPYLARNFKLVSTDNYIENIAANLGKTYGEVFKQNIDAATSWMNKVIRLYTEACENIIWDQTNLTMKGRRKKLDTLMAAGYDVVAVTFEIPDAELTARRRARAAATGKTIPPSIMESMGKTYVRPTRLEGFSKVIIVTPTEEYVADE